MCSQKVLVAGGAGYIGAHTCKALKLAGYQPVVYDNLVTGHRAAVRWGPFEHGDILDRVRLENVLIKHRPIGVMHFAAFAYVGESVTQPEKYYRNNVSGSLELLQTCQNLGIRNIIFSSSCSVYGIPEAVPITEKTPLAPINPYGRTKMIVEQMLRDFAAADLLSFMALRYFNAAGADPDGEIGEDHEPETRIIPLAIEAAGNKRNPLRVFGTDYPTEDGTCIRDYVHVSDLADAHVLALQALESKAESQVLNLGSGVGASVREVIGATEDVTGKAVYATYEDRRPGDPPKLVADATMAMKTLAWKPRFTDLRQIVRTAARWKQKNGAPVIRTGADT